MTKQVLAQTGHRAFNLRFLNSMDVAVALDRIETSSVYGHLWLVHLPTLNHTKTKILLAVGTICTLLRANFCQLVER